MKRNENMKKSIVLILVLTLLCSAVSIAFASESTAVTQTALQENVTEIAYHEDGSYAVTNTSTFSYTGSSSTCTSVSASKSITDSSWTVTTSTIKSGNTGRVHYSGKCYQSGVLVNTNSDYVSITCSSTGVLS